MRALTQRPAGFSLVEVLLVLSGAAILTGLVGMTVQRANAVFREAGTASESDTAAQRAVERIARELMLADRSSITLTPDPVAGGDTITFRRTVGAGVLGVLQRLRFELAPGEFADGLDNDGDGLVDEGRVVLNTDVAGAGRDVVLASGVSARLQGELADGFDNNGNGLVDESGLAMTFDAATATLTLRLTVSRVAANGRVVERTATTSVRIRNE